MRVKESLDLHECVFPSLNSSNSRLRLSSSACARRVACAAASASTGTRRSSGGAVTPSIHPEVLDSLFVSPGRGNGIRQLMGWRKVCGSAGSGIRVPKGDARARMLPADLDHLRVGWRKQVVTRDRLGHARARLSVFICVWTWSRVDGVIGLWCSVAPLLSPWCARGNRPTRVNLNQYASPGSCIRLHSDIEPLFGPQSS